MTEYLPKYAPDYWEVIHRPEYATALQSLTTSSGKLFNFAAITENDYNLTCVGPVVRKDWLRECNLEEPVTMDDWENMLVTFKEKYGARLGFNLAQLNKAGLGSGTGGIWIFRIQSLFG